MKMNRKEFEQMAPQVRLRLVERALKYLGNPDDAEDVAQETLLKLWTLRDRLDSSRSMMAMAMVAGRNRCIDMLRRQGVNRLVPLEDFEVASADVTPLAAIIAGEDVERLNGIIASLPEGQRIVLEMKHRDGLEVEEIARLTGSNANSIRVALSRARHRVRDIFMNK